MIKKFNLRLFDNDPYTYDPNMNKTTSEGLTAEMKTFYDKNLLEVAGPNLVHQQFGKKVGIPKNNGKTVEFRKFSTLPKALTPLTEGVTPDGTPLNVSTVTATCYEYGNYSTITDVLDLTSIDNVILEATNLHGKNAGQTLDTIVRNELVTGMNKLYAEDSQGNVPTSRAGVTSDNKLTAKTVAKAAAIMKKNNVPTIDGSYVCIIHPSVEFDLITSQGWLDVSKYTDAVSRVFKGEIGKLYGIRFVVSTEAKIWTNETGYTSSGTGTTPITSAVYACIVLGKDAYGVVDVNGGGLEMIIKQKGSAGTADPLNQRSTVGWKATAFTAKILIPEYILRIECGSEFSSTDVAN